MAGNVQDPLDTETFLDGKPPGLDLQNSMDALDASDRDEQIPMVSMDDYPPISFETEIEKKIMPLARKFIKKTQKARKEERRDAEGANVMEV